MRLCVVLSLLLLPCLAQQKNKNNIVFILADDMGWADISWADYPQIPTPNLAELRENGVELTQFYSQPKSTATRAALMTGRYAFKLGLQTNKVFGRHKNHTLDLSLKLMPAFLKEKGYATHIVGKWHLGFCAEAANPTNRGFDTFFGPFTGLDDHYTHSTKGGYDWNWHRNGRYDTYREANGTYDTFLITSHTQELLKDHFNNASTADSPIFIYAAYLAGHTPVQAPRQYVDDPVCSQINKTDIRRTYCGMIKALDEGVGNITNTLKELGVLNDTLIIFTSDNGGAVKYGASNWPLRGSKQNVFEGGTRTRLIMHAPKFLQDTPIQYDGLVHMVDMLPTLYTVAGGELEELPGDLDGENMWHKIRNNLASTREWMVYNIDDSRGEGAIRLKNSTHNFKLVYLNRKRCQGWTRDPRALEDRDGRAEYVPCPEDGYRLFNMDTNPEELEPGLRPDAALVDPPVLQLMKTKLNELKLEEVPVPVYTSLPADGPGRPRNNNGAFGVGDCD